MKLVTLFLIIGMSVSFAESTYSQSTLLSMYVENKTVKDVFKELEKNSEYIIFYYDGAVDLNRRVSIDVKKQTVDKILDQLFKDTENTYKIKDRQIVIYKNNSTLPLPPSQKKKKVKGQVLDEFGVPLPGVTIILAGSTSGVITDLDGKFEIDVLPTDKLTFSYIGYEKQELAVNDTSYFKITLQPKKEQLEEVVVTAFATQKKSTMVGSVATINPKELKGPTSNITNMMAGRVAGIISYQTSGEPGKDNSNFFIRGITSFGTETNPLILINGIESSTNDFARLQPDDIAAFSILKDASAAALYGSRAANGVILVNTKSGIAGKTKINVRYEASVSSNTRNFKMADNISFMELANEATLTRSPLTARPYSLDKIAKTKKGANPLLYPNNDWVGMMVKDNTLNHRFNVNISGGGTKVAYYVSGTVNLDNGILQNHSLNDFNTNVRTKHYDIRANIDIDLTPSTVASVRLNGRFDSYNGPIDGGSEIFRKIRKANPVQFPALYDQSFSTDTKHPLFGSKYFKGTATYFNPYAYALSGYSQSDESTYLAQIEVKQNFDFLLKGLNARIMAYTKRYSYYDVKRSYTPFLYAPISNEEGDVESLTLLNEKSATEYLSYNEGGKALNSQDWLEAAVSYNTQINKLHDISAMLVWCASNYRQANAGNLQKSLPSRNLSLSGRLTYGYDSKYMAEFNFGYNGSERFDKNHRFGFFPSIGVAWNMAEETFMEPYKKTFDKIKIRASYGIVGNDAIGSQDDRFFYLSQVNTSAQGYTFGYNFSEHQAGYAITRYGNSDITWEKSAKTDLAFELGLINAFNMEIDFFKEKRTNILMNRSNIPGSMGLTNIPRANVGEASSKGFDAMMNFQKSLTKDIWLSLKGTFTYATSKIDVNEEPDYPADQRYLSHIGQPINQAYGYIAERLFTDEEEVINSPKQNFGNYMAGDIKYHDINGDGQITELDKVPIGGSTVPEIVYGFGFSLGIKDFDISAYFQGQGRSTFFIDASDIAPFLQSEGGYETGLLKNIADDHWSETNRNLYAFYPRLSTGIIHNNIQTSTWWMRNGSFLRLKSVELGWNMPVKLLKKCGLSNFRIYVNGLNLFAFSKFKLWDVEMGGQGLTNYPVQRTFNAGIMIGI